MHIPNKTTNFATKIVSVWPPLRKRFIPTFRFFVRKVGYFKKVGNMTQEEFIKRCKNKYGDDFDYSMIIYQSPSSRIKLKCNLCGSTFEMRANHFLYEKRKGCCPKCKYNLLRNKFSLKKEAFIERSVKLYGHKYDYSKIEYVNMHSMVRIICKEHGEFSVTPMSHLDGKECPLCKCFVSSNMDRDMANAIFVKRSKNIHGNKYDYSQVEYVNAKTPVRIICKKHGLFLQAPTLHMNGCGCPLCKRSLGEERVELFLVKNSIQFERQYKVHNENLFCGNKNFYVDFYLEKYNIIIEYNGAQHYTKTGYFGGEKKLADTQERDMALRQYCKEHKIKLIEIPYTEYDNIETILKNELNII